MIKAFDVRIEVAKGGLALVAFSGELDLASAPQAEAALRNAEREQPNVLVIDLRQLEFIDSSGVNAILRTQLRARTAGRKLLLVRGNENIQRLFRVAGLGGRLEFVNDLPTR